MNVEFKCKNKRLNTKIIKIHQSYLLALNNFMLKTEYIDNKIEDFSINSLM